MTLCQHDNIIKIPIEISARHVHITQEHLEKLFGRGYKLTPLRKLSQDGEFAAKETVNLVNGKYVIKNVRIAGPVRSHTQVEVAKDDAYDLKINPPVRISGDIKGTPGIKLVGPKGELDLKEGVIVAKRHIHASPEDAKRYGIRNNDIVSVRVSGIRALTFEDVVVRVAKNFRWSFHVDTDEGNAAWVNQGDIIEVIPKNKAIKITFFSAETIYHQNF